MWGQRGFSELSAPVGEPVLREFTSQVDGGHTWLTTTSNPDRSCKFRVMLTSVRWSVASQT